jgi:DNA gyrase subunit B
VAGKMKRGESTGTSIRYWYDPSYFEAGAALDVEAVRAKLRNTAFLVPGVTYVPAPRHRQHDRRRDLPLPRGLSDMIELLTPPATGRSPARC